MSTFDPNALVNDSKLLTDAEIKAMDMTADLYNHVTKNVIASERGTLMHSDNVEFTTHIHNIQRMIMAQAACRAYPERYRLLGESMRRTT